ncbi:YdeI/OmpD-associated family protein [Hymenobacter sp. J193]|uniref:YdeI/OmpD-associated family protein n=1 Tax=Hymenobacter sp. J193 TaxID=2898429 RepID=UPI002151B962|nr:YdeI/OmpD-associated family protein [Hymenobacter sp. J193]MCR5889066.1 YdeI/OmpD-associated family protein [Hymenobacter sp. J193]
MHITLSRDTEERIVTVPDDLAAALSRAGLRQRFDELSFTHRKEFVQGIERSKKYETRLRRIDDAVERIAAGRKP